MRVVADLVNEGLLTSDDRPILVRMHHDFPFGQGLLRACREQRERQRHVLEFLQEQGYSTLTPSTTLPSGLFSGVLQ